MELPSKRKRHSIYKATKQVAIEDEDNDVGLCYWLTHNKVNNHGRYPFYDAYSAHLECFPEIAEQEPASHSIEDEDYWFDLTDKQSRLDILDNAIAKTAPKPRNL